ncbi:MAG: hypothetical protein ACE5FI_17685 [Anaerolineales bacterium]
MYVQNQLLFPSEAISIVQESRGPEWASLVKRVKNLPELHPEKLSFCLTMIRFNGCLDCETDSYRAMRGCDQCSLQTLRRYHGPDCDLFDIYERASQDVAAYMGCAQQQAA